MHLDDHELRFIRRVLLARRMYRNTELPLNAKSWEGWMQPLLDRIDTEIRIRNHGE